MLSVPVSERTAIAPTKTPETMFAASRTRRRGSRSEITPPKSNIAMCGSVKASHTTASAVALFESVSVCQPIATNQIPSPSSEIVLADQRSRKSRLAKGARKRLIPCCAGAFARGTRWSRHEDGRRRQAAPRPDADNRSSITGASCPRLRAERPSARPPLPSTDPPSGVPLLGDMSRTGSHSR